MRRTHQLPKGKIFSTTHDQLLQRSHGKQQEQSNPVNALVGVLSVAERADQTPQDSLHLRTDSGEHNMRCIININKYELSIKGMQLNCKE